MSLSQSTLTSFLKRSAPETHDADDGISNDVHSKRKKAKITRKSMKRSAQESFNQRGRRAKMKYEVYILPFSIVVVVYFWTSSFVVRISKIHIVYLSQGTSELKRKFLAL